MKSFTIFPTSNASRHLATLCTHFGKKVKTHYDSHAGWIQFPFGRCELTAEDSQLNLLAEAADRSQLDQVMQTITSHLERFAFRENPILDWQYLPDTSPKEPLA